MTKWEYKTFEHKPDQFRKFGEDELRGYGNEGWEVVGVTYTGRGGFYGWWGSVGRVVVVMKRPVAA